MGHLYVDNPPLGNKGVVRGRRFGSFQAGSGIYMTNGGKMFIYAVEYFNTLADVDGKPGVGMTEFSY